MMFAARGGSDDDPFQSTHGTLCPMAEESVTSLGKPNYRA